MREKFTLHDLNKRVKEVFPSFKGFTPNQDKSRVEALEYGSSCYLDFLDFMACEHAPDPNAALVGLAIHRISYCANETARLYQ